MSAYEGTKAYSEAFDLVHRREASGPNAIWQADHSSLDILLAERVRTTCRVCGKPTLTLAELDNRLRSFLLDVYYRWPESLEQLDLLRDGIHFHAFRYFRQRWQPMLGNQ